MATRGTIPRGVIVGGRTMFHSDQIEQWLASLPIRKLKGDPEAVSRSAAESAKSCVMTRSRGHGQRAIKMTNNLIQFPPLGADEHARAETERKRQLFAWADRVLREMGLAERVARASSLDELRKITFDADAPTWRSPSATRCPARGSKAG